MPTVLLFAQARMVAGTGQVQLPGATVAEVVEAAVQRFGPAFAAVLPTCALWVDGEPADPGDEVHEGSEVAVLPPVSGG